MSDGNNGRNRAHAKMIHELWAAAEWGPGHRAVGAHYVGAPYVERRAAIVQQYAPTLTADEVRHVAEATTGLVQADVIAAAVRFERERVLPVRTRMPGEVPVDPDGATQERLFDPYALASDIASLGFRTKVLGYWGGASGSRVVRAANATLAACSRLTISTTKTFRIVAVKLG